MCVPYNEMKNEFTRVLIKREFEEETAEIAASIITDKLRWSVFTWLEQVSGHC